MAIGETIVGRLWTSFDGISIEKLLDELLKNGINQKKSLSKESEDVYQSRISQTSSSTMINSNDNLLYNLSYLSSVIHPVIILRLLQHKIFTPLFKKKSHFNNSSNQTNDYLLNSNNDTSILSSIPTSNINHKIIQQQQSNSLIKYSKSINDKDYQINENQRTTSISNNQSDLSSIKTNNSNQPLTTTTTTTRKWFWKNSDKVNELNDINPLLKNIGENDLLSSSSLGCIYLSKKNEKQVGDMKLFEKELLNLPSFQLSDSQNPLLPSPTCLSYDFSTQFYQTNINLNRQYSTSNIITNSNHSLTNHLHKSKQNNRHLISPMIEKGIGKIFSSHNIPFIPVNKPSNEINQRLNVPLNISRSISSSNIGKTVQNKIKNLFRTSKTIDNMNYLFVNRNKYLSKTNENLFICKSSSNLSHSQPNLNENFNNHSEKSPLIKYDKNIKIITKYENQNKLNTKINYLHRSHSCNDNIIIESNNKHCSLIKNFKTNSTKIKLRNSLNQSQSSLSLNKQTNNINKSEQSIYSYSSQIDKHNSIKSLVIDQYSKDKTTKQDNDVLILIASWVLRSPEDFQDYLVQKELKTFFSLLESLRSSFRTWTSQIKEILALQDDDIQLDKQIDDVITEDIYREYIKMQRDIIYGRLICSKEEAATLAALQLRIQTWPEENIDIIQEDDFHRLNIRLNDERSSTVNSLGFDNKSSSLTQRNISNIIHIRLSDIYCCKPVDYNCHKSKKPYLPPNFRHSNDISKLIKDKQRKLFHINDYDNARRLKECYIRLCRNLPGYNAEIYLVKEIHGKRSKRKENRLLCIRSDKIYLLDNKNNIICKEERMADVEHWITSGHDLNARINQLILEFRNKTKWRLQLNTTADLRAITVYLWKIVNVEGFALLDKHIPLCSSSLCRYSQIEQQTNNSLINNLNKKNHFENLKPFIENNRRKILTGMMINSSYINQCDNNQLYSFSPDLEELKNLFDFPEEVAIRLTDIEHEIFLSVPPLQYLRHLTLDISYLSTHDTSLQGKNIRILLQRFQAVGSFIQQLIVSQTNFQERKSLVASILRCAITCWYIGNFNSAMQILAGLKIEAFRPLWLTITDEIPGFKLLMDAFNSNEKTAQYCDALSRALDIPTCKVVPFFGTFLKDLRTILSSVPSIVVLSNRNTQKTIEDGKGSCSIESDLSSRLKSQENRSNLSSHNKINNIGYKTKSSLVFQTVKPRRSLILNNNSIKQRSPLTANRRTRSSNSLNNPINTNNINNRFLSTNINNNNNNNGKVNKELSSPWIINENSLDFIEFVQLFKSFYFHCRRDLKDLFDKFASEIHIEQDYTIKEQYKYDLLDMQRQLTGLITRNIIQNINDDNKNRIYDMIAISSIPCYAISTHTRHNYLITIDLFKLFLIEHQKEDKHFNDIQLIIYRHEPNRENRLNKVLSFEGFSRYLLDKDNYAFVNEHTKVNEREMNYPLSYYFIASSHNTYLTGHQLRGESSVEMYREVLLSGCRCIELDCWDGEDGYPVIYHGRTFVSKISFKLVVEVINESAFVTSPYPVILSIENRCSLIQQSRMAQIFVKIFGDKLITKYMFDKDFHEDPLLPSPNQLKYKILIKNKKINNIHSTTQIGKQKIQLTVNYRNSVYSSPDDNDDDEDSDDEDIIDDYNYEQYTKQESQRSNSMTDSPIYHFKKDNINQTVYRDPDEDLRSYRQRRYSIMNNQPRQRLKSTSSIDTNHISKVNKSAGIMPKIPTILVAKDLSDIVIYTQAIKFRGLSCSSISASSIAIKSIRKTPKRTIQQLVAQPSTTSTESSRSVDQVSPCHQIVSLIENKAKKLCKSQGIDMIAHTETQLVRCYPSGFRVDSSNLNPLHLWIYGIQLAATNYQTLDAGQILNLSMFEQNGNCGYVLKPNVFWDKEHSQYGRFNPSVIEREGSCFELTITIISGQYLTQNVSSTTNVYIEVELLGIPIDCMSRKTKPSIKNSLNPIWQETFIFQLFFMELSFVRFHVYDAGSNHLICQRVMPAKCLRPGYRHVRLRDPTNVPLELTTLFIYSKITETILIRSPESDLSTSNTPHIFRNRILRRTVDPSEAVATSRESIRPKHKTFEVKVYGKDGRDEEFRPFAVTQYTTVEELIEMIAKTNDFLQIGETINDIILTESSKTWKKKNSSTKYIDISPRILEKYERILEVIDRVGRETVILCKRKAQTPYLTHSPYTTNNNKNIENLQNSDRTFLVTIYNISSVQKHTTFRTSINSTASHVITQLMRKIRMNGISTDYGLVEETNLKERNRRFEIKRRLISDDEKIYGIQRLWTSTNSKFILVKKSEYTQMNNNNNDKSLFRSLTRQKSIDRDSHEDLHQSKSRINNNLTFNSNIINNRSSNQSIESLSITNQAKHSFKTLFLTNRS
ncbi:unnamed protein product [Rotaria sp. Silwood1]|nr:unnamed protein product [Rotaria sp. Silwood1]